MNNFNYEDCSFMTEEAYAKLKSMHLSGMAENLLKQMNDPNAGLKSFEERVSELINAEYDTRQTRKLNKFIKRAGFKYPHASLDESIYDQSRQLDTDSIERLASCEWINMKKNLIITGKSSTGKTYTANALGISAVGKYKHVLYRKASTILNELRSADINGCYAEVLGTLAAVDLLIIDDFGLMELDINRCRNLFEVLDARDTIASTMIISQIPVENWYDLFNNHTYADACMERMIRNAYRLEFNGRNMREA